MSVAQNFPYSQYIEDVWNRHNPGPSALGPVTNPGLHKRPYVTLSHSVLTPHRITHPAYVENRYGPVSSGRFH
jgi:hypothetical protein